MKLPFELESEHNVLILQSSDQDVTDILLAAGVAKEKILLNF